jgi:cholesterol oxidase
MRAHYEVVVVGSGYGGAITACRAAQARRDVCVLERGRELVRGEYPDRLRRAIRKTQVRIRGRHFGDPRSLLDFHLDGDMNVLVGSGLGGTSLINANVAVRADPEVFTSLDDQNRYRWPAPLTDPTVLAPFYAEAEAMLTPVVVPELPRKLRALAASAEVDDAAAIRAPIAVTFEDGPNACGVEQKACTGCGDCVTGCNVGAKNTLLMNYLPVAVDNGAEVFTEVEVRAIRRGHDHWIVSYWDRTDSMLAGPTRIVTADAVVLSAGTLGTSEILLRSRAAGLELSDRLGEDFSGNGDVLGFGYDGACSVNGIGVAQQPSLVDEPPGPCITGMHVVDDDGPLGGEILVEDAVIPRAIARLVRPGLALAALIESRGRNGRPIRVSEVLFGLLRTPYGGPADRTQTFLVMSHDGDGGSLVLDEEHDRVVVHWPDAGTQAPYPGANRVLSGFAAKLCGIFVPSPAWSRHMGHKLVTVHPLGGAVMGDDATRGVVDHTGQVFRGTVGTSVHPGLWVADGSMVPTPIGMNPLLTISALAERTSEFLVASLPVLDLGEDEPAMA